MSSSIMARDAILVDIVKSIFQIISVNIAP